MRPLTTPTHRFKFKVPIDPASIKRVSIVYSQENINVLKKTEKDCTIESDRIFLKLTQDETNLFREGKTIEIQLRLYTTGGDAPITKIVREACDKTLDDEVLK